MTALSFPARLTLLVSLYGGLGALGLLVLVAGLFLARRRASIVAVALVGGALLLVQFLVLYFLSDVGRGWSSEGFGALPAVVGAAGAIAVIGFLSYKLPRAEAISSDASLAKLAGGIMLLWVVAFVAPPLLQGTTPAGVRALASQNEWLIVGGALLVAWGLWGQQGWAWWCGLAGAAWQLGSWALAAPSGPLGSLFTVSGLRAALLLAFLLVLLLPDTRRSCIR